MLLTPEVIDMAKKEIPLTEYYNEVETVTAQHILFKLFIEGTLWKGVPKMIFYILLQDFFGPPHLKDKNGDLGYAIQLKNELPEIKHVTK
jgi:hypothetical protein